MKQSLVFGVMVLGALVSAACSDAEDGSFDDTGGQSAQGGDASVGGAGGSPSSNGGGGVGGAGIDDRIDPIATGRAWTYDVEEIGTFALCPSGSHTAETVAELELDGKHAFEVTNFCASVPSSYFAVDGDVVQVNYMGTWILALDAPVEEGHTWSNGTSTFTWHEEGTVTVPAGTFDDCWRATQNVTYEAYTIFCRGVGPIHWYSVDLAGNGFDAELTGKNF